MSHPLFQDQRFMRGYFSHNEHTRRSLISATGSVLGMRIPDLLQYISPAQDINELPPIILDPSQPSDEEISPLHAKLATPTLLDRLKTALGILRERRAGVVAGTETVENAQRLLGMTATVVSLLDPRSSLSPFPLTQTQTNIVASYVMLREMTGNRPVVAEGDRAKVVAAYALFNDAVLQAAFEVDAGE